MIYDQVEQIYTVLNANFAADYAALLAAKGVADPGAFTYVMRQRAEIARKYGQAPPFIGVYSIAGRTEAKQTGQQKRDTQGLVAVDVFLLGTDPELVARQVELAVEAALGTVDRLAASGNGVFGAGELPRSIAIDFADAYEEGEQGKYWRVGTVRFPCDDRDTV